MKIETHIPLIDDVVGRYAAETEQDLTGYRNHVYRIVNFCFAQSDYNDEQRHQIIIAGCFHDIGIWTAETFDYLLPSIELAGKYLRESGLESWRDEIATMIDQHHRLRNCEEGSLTETFRRADLADFSLGLVVNGLSRKFINEVKNEFPNAGFHRQLVGHACRWILRHPLNPVPVLKW